MGFQHLDFGVLVRVAHGDPGHEPVALGLGQRVGAFHLDGVLGGHHHEGLVELVGSARPR